MRNLRTVLYLLTLVGAATFFACSNSGNGPTGGNGNTIPGGTFAFKAGNTFHFDEWSLDSNSNRIPVTHELIRQVIVDTAMTYQGKTGVAMAIDTVTDTSGNFISNDTTYYYTDGQAISVYGFISRIIYQYSNGAASVSPKWNMMVDAGNTTGWLTDTTTANVSGVNGTEQTNGKDTGNVYITIAGNSLTADHAVHHGTISAGILGSTQILLNVYAVYSPTVIASMIASPTKFASVNVNGVEIELSSYVVK